MSKQQTKAEWQAEQQRKAAEFQAVLEQVPAMVKRVVDSKESDTEAYEWLKAHPIHFWTYAAGRSFTLAARWRQDAEAAQDQSVRDHESLRAHSMQRRGEHERDTYRHDSIPDALEMWDYYPLEAR